MRTRIQTIVTAFVLLSLVSGAIGCRSNGGPWYHPKTYSFHNPFGAKEAPLFGADESAQANARPSMGEQPNVNTPPGGYTNKEEEARFNAGNKEKALLTQYDAASLRSDTSRVASANTSVPQSFYPDNTINNPGYTPYGTYGGNDILPNAGYQHTTLHSANAVTPSSVYPGSATPMGSTPAASPATDAMVYPGVAAPSSTVMPSAAESYSPYGTPASGATTSAAPAGVPIYGDPAATNPMGSAMGTQGFAAPVQNPMAPPAAPQGFGQTGFNQMPPQQNPLGNVPVNQSTVGYTSAPSTYPAAVPQGF